MSKKKKKQKKLCTTNLLFNMDHSVTITEKKSYSEDDLRYVSYVLIPSIDDGNFYIMEPSDLLDIKQARIVYQLIPYEGDSFELELAMEHSDLKDMLLENFYDTTDSSLHEVVVTNVFELCNCLGNILKIQMVSEFYDTTANYEEFIGIGPLVFYADVETNSGKHLILDWEYSNKITIQSNIQKIYNKVQKFMHIPTKDFFYQNKRIIVRNNKWKVIPQKKVEDYDLIGVFCDSSSLVAFINAEDDLCPLIMSTEFTLYAFRIKDLMKFSPDFLHDVLNDPKYYRKATNLPELHHILDDAPLIFEIPINIYIVSDLLGFLLNLHYVFKYTCGLGAAIEGCQIEEVMSVCQCRPMDSADRNEIGTLIFDNFHVPSISYFRDYFDPSLSRKE